MIFKNKHIKIEVENSVIPWLKIFTQKSYKEFSQCDKIAKDQILKALDIIEKNMLEYFKPTKINIASFGNYMPHVHFHIMARFEDDPYFPEPMWGKQQREVKELNLKDFNIFYESLYSDLKSSLE
jgi:diadenosine tetraphosphate (Ap4A) HIT family hydrolase